MRQQIRRNEPSTRLGSLILASDRLIRLNGVSPKVEREVVEFATKATVEPRVSYLQHIFTLNGVQTLHQSKITEQGLYYDFETFLIGFKARAIYPTLQATKFEAYGWTPTLFEEGIYKGKLGHWRRAEFATDALTLFYADVDNNNEAFEAVSLDQIEATCKALGVSYLLYTSFSHTREKHKVRIVTPVSREMTYAEGFKVHLLFNELLNRQLDASIYDPADYLYGPGPKGEIRSDRTGLSLDVDAVLAFVDQFDETALALLHAYEKKVKEPPRPLTPDEAKTVFQANRNAAVRADVSIRNPAVFNPNWFADLFACSNGGSHHMTLFQLLTKVHVKTSYELGFAELWSVLTELDAEWGNYCQNKYGKCTLQDDLRSVLQFRGTKSMFYHTDKQDYQKKFEQNLRRISK